MKGKSFINLSDLRRLRPVNSPYESLALVRKGTIMCIVAYVVSANRFQTVPSTSQIHWSFKVRNMHALFSPYF